MTANHIPRSSLQAEVVARLRAEIINGHWHPGTRLQEQLLCERYGISRSPLREAFQVLASEALIDILPNKGVVVTAPTPSLALQNFTLLLALELLAVRLACAMAKDEEIAGIAEAEAVLNACVASGDRDGFFRANNQLHRLIVVASGNRPLADAHLIASRQLIRLQNLNGPLEHPVSKGMSEHNDIITALRSRDAVRAEAAMAGHLHTVEKNLLERLRSLKTIPD